MKTKKGFNLRQVCGENIIVAEGEENIDFSNIISMNETSAYLWKNIQGKDNFTAEDLVALLQQEYDVDPSVALEDTKALINQWIDAGIVEVEGFKDIPSVNITTDQQKEKASTHKTESNGYFKKLFGR